MKVAELVPGSPAICESCGKHIVVEETLMFQEAYISYAALINQQEFALLCHDCCKIQELLNSDESFDWSLTEQDIREALEEIDNLP